METIEIKDEEINVEDIMRQIRDNIKKRRESGAYTSDMEDIINQPLQALSSSAAPRDFQQNPVPIDLAPNLDYINSNWDLHAEYHISSHRGILGKPLVWGRQLVHGEARRYVDLLAGKQSEFNAHVVRTLNNFARDFDGKVKEAVASLNKDIDNKLNEAVAAVDKDIDNKLNEAVAAVDKDIDNKLNEAVAAVDKDIDNKLNEAVAAVYKDIDNKLNEAVATAVNKDIDNKLNETVAAMNSDIENKAWLANLLDEKIKSHNYIYDSDINKDNINYFIFRDYIAKAWSKLSGDAVQGVPNIFEDSFNLLDKGKNVLDIGCGDGTFLQMLKERGIKGYGIDVNEDLILYCKRKELCVEHVDALTHLKSLQDKTLDGVFSAHVIEHMQLYELKQMLSLCYEKMQFGSYIILVTPNILNMTVSTNTFYMDPTHLNHIHPDVIKFLFESCGFREIQKRFYQPVPEQMKMKKIKYDLNSKEKEIFETMNYNINILNNLLFGYRDLAVIAKK
jgi:O-antigen chain-terminating methyltransferase